MRSKSTFIAVVASGLFAASMPAVAQQPAYSLQEVFAANRSAALIELIYPADTSQALYAVYQPGVIKVFIRSNNTQAPATFLDIRSQIVYGGEQGLLGLEI